MKKHYWVYVAAILLGATFCFGAMAPTAQAGPIELSYAHFAPPKTFVHVQMVRWVKEVEKRTGGKVKFKTFPGGSLLGAKNMLDGVVAGQADIGSTCMAYQPGRFVITNATSLPLGIPNAVVGGEVLMDLYRQYKPKAFAKVKVLTLYSTSPCNIMSKVALPTLASLKGVDLRASGGAAQILKAWGANQVGMPMPATPEALQKGVVKGLFSSVEVMMDFKFADYCKYVTMTDTGIYPFSVFMNMDKWNSLPADVKKVMDDLFWDQGVWTGKYMDGHAAKSLEWSQKNKGVKVFRLSKAEKAKFDARLEPIVAGWVKKVSAKGMKGQALVDDIKALIKKHTGK
ncbi:MAG: TRAP transporter substrate-binding protein [Desulfarculaceae bacterium]|jgi:TRAP-type C4-dicarboxylate transport system substrate-binding protein